MEKEKMCLIGKKYWIVILLINLFFLLFVRTVCEQAQPCEILLYSYGNKNEEAVASSFRLTSINADGEELKLSEIYLPEGFYYDLVYDDIICSPNEEGKEYLLNISLGAYSDIFLSFAQNPECGLIGIKDGTHYTEIDLFATEYLRYEYKIANNFKTETFKEITLNYLKVVFIFILILILLAYLGCRLMKMGFEILNTCLKLGLWIVVLNYFLVLFNRYYFYNNFVRIVAISSILLLGWNIKQDKIEKSIILFIVTLYLTFTVFGHAIFLPIFKTYISKCDIFIFLGLSIIIYPLTVKIVYFLNYNTFQLLDRLASYLLDFWSMAKNTFIVFYLLGIAFLTNMIANQKFDFFISVCIACIITVLVILVICIYNKLTKGRLLKYFLFSVMLLFPCFLIFNPANVTADSIDQISQAYGIIDFSNHHPVMHTLLERALLCMHNNVAIISFFQIFMLAFVYARAARLLFDRGCSYNMSLLYLTIGNLLPATTVHIVTLWKDVLFGVGILWLIIIIAEIIENCSTTFRKKRNILELFVASLIVGTFRHNGSLVLVGVFLILIIYHLRQKLYKYALFLICSLSTVFIFNNAILDYLNVSPNGSLASVVLFHGMAYETYLDIDQSTAVQMYLEEIMNLEDIKEVYYPYSANPYMYTEVAANNDTMKKFREADLAKVVKLYLNTAILNPYFLIKDRLYGTDLLWNVFPGIDSYNYMYETGIEVNSLNIERAHTFIEEIVIAALKLSEKLSIIFWRSGIYIDGMLLMLYVALERKNVKLFFVTMPVVFNVFSLFLSMAWQEYRYVWFVWLGFWFLLFYNSRFTSDTDVET